MDDILPAELWELVVACLVPRGCMMPAAMSVCARSQVLMRLADKDVADIVASMSAAAKPWQKRPITPWTADTPISPCTTLVVVSGEQAISRYSDFATSGHRCYLGAAAFDPAKGHGLQKLTKLTLKEVNIVFSPGVLQASLPLLRRLEIWQCTTAAARDDRACDRRVEFIMLVGCDSPAMIEWLAPLVVHARKLKLCHTELDCSGLLRAATSLTQLSIADLALPCVTPQVGSRLVRLKVQRCPGEALPRMDRLARLTVVNDVASLPRDLPALRRLELYSCFSAAHIPNAESLTRLVLFQCPLRRQFHGIVFRELRTLEFDRSIYSDEDFHTEYDDTSWPEDVPYPCDAEEWPYLNRRRLLPGVVLPHTMSCLKLGATDFPVLTKVRGTLHPNVGIETHTHLRQLRLFYSCRDTCDVTIRCGPVDSLEVDAFASIRVDGGPVRELQYTASCPDVTPAPEKVEQVASIAYRFR